MITRFLRDVGVETLDWPLQSPDLNIIENVWSLIKIIFFVGQALKFV